MSAESKPGQSAPVTNSQRAGRTTDAREGARYDNQYRLQNSYLSPEPGLSGPVIHVVRHDTAFYAGPFEDLTLEEVDRTLAEVADERW